MTLLECLPLITLSWLDLILTLPASSGQTFGRIHTLQLMCPAFLRSRLRCICWFFCGCSGETSFCHTPQNWNAGQSEQLEVKACMWNFYKHVKSKLSGYYPFTASRKSFNSQVRHQQFIPWWTGWSRRWQPKIQMRFFFIFRLILFLSYGPLVYPAYHCPMLCSMYFTLSPPCECIFNSIYSQDESITDGSTINAPSIKSSAPRPISQVNFFFWSTLSWFFISCFQVSVLPISLLVLLLK